jgi:hypothetical protein
MEKVQKFRLYFQLRVLYRTTWLWPTYYLRLSRTMENQGKWRQGVNLPEPTIDR